MGDRVAPYGGVGAEKKAIGLPRAAPLVQPGKQEPIGGIQPKRTRVSMQQKALSPLPPPSSGLAAPSASPLNPVKPLPRLNESDSNSLTSAAPGPASAAHLNHRLAGASSPKTDRERRKQMDRAMEVYGKLARVRPRARASERPAVPAARPCPAPSARP